MLRKFNRKVFSRISVEENEDVIDAAPEVSANGEGTYDMSTPELENEKQELVELGDGIDAGVEEIETCCDDCETVIEIDNIVKDSVDSNNGLDQTSINIINTTVENMLKRHGLSRMRFRIPSVERYGRPLDKVKQAKVALEGIKEIFEWIWKKIKAIWEAICGFFKKIFGNSVNIFKKQIKEAYKAVMDLKKDKSILDENITITENDWELNNLKVTSDIVTCLIVQDLNPKRLKNAWLVEANDAFKDLSNRRNGVISLMDHVISIGSKMDSAMNGQDLVNRDKESSLKDVEPDDGIAAAIYRAFDVPDACIKYFTKDEKLKANLNYGINPENSSAGIVDDLIRLVEELKKASDKADEELIDKFIKDMESKYVEILKKNVNWDEMDEKSKKDLLDSIKKRAALVVETIKYLYTYLSGYSSVILLMATNIRSYINLLKKVKSGK